MPRLLAILAAALLSACAAVHEPIPSGVPEKYVGLKAPRSDGLQLRPGDRLAICGDSITEQKMYSRVIEAYLAAARPDLGIACRQYGWSGEQAGGFLRRMQNDVLRFRPTVATTCYGMNDFRYVPYQSDIGEAYRSNMTQIVRNFRTAGARTIVGSPGTIHSVPHWVKGARGTWEDLNLSLLKFRDIAIEVAEDEGAGFADVYWPMLTIGHRQRALHGEAFKLEGADGVHPGWAGHMVMATAFLDAMGLDGDLGTIEAEFTPSGMNVSSRDGQRALRVRDGQVLPPGLMRVIHDRIPFAVEPGDVRSDATMAAGAAITDFHARFNRLTLRVTGLKGSVGRVTWGGKSKDFTAAALASGVNLAAEFPDNPTLASFAAIWKAVGEKQAYETKQIKTLLHSKEAKADMEKVVRESQVEFERLEAALRSAGGVRESELHIEDLGSR
jgi:lysophospholipase L1-like esterase